MMLQLAMPAVFAAVTATSAPVPPNFYVTTNATSVCKGVVNYVPITVHNNGVPVSLNLGSQSAAGPPMVNAQLTVINSKTGYYSTNSLIVLPSINASKNATGYLAWFVPQNVSSIATLQMGVNYFYYTVYEDQETRNLSFSAQSCGLPLSLNITPKILVSGEVEKIQIALKNSGALPVSTVSVGVSAPTTDIAQLSALPLQLQSIPAGATAILNDTVFVGKNATLSFPLNVTADYYVNGAFEQAASYKQTLAEGLINLSASSVTTSPSIPSPGGIFSISFILTDTGTSGASTVTVASQHATGFTPYGPSSVFVGSIAAAGQSPVTLTFQASRNITAGTYTIPVVINYLDNFRNNVSSVISVPITIGAGGVLGAANITNGVVRYKTAGSGSGVFTLILIVIIAALAYLYYKERKRRHPK